MIGYLDLPSGISGDMFLGCLIDAGWSIDQLRAALDKLHLPDPVKVDAREVMKGPLRAMRVNVHSPENEEHPHQQHEHAHGHHPHSHEHSHEHHHHHDHGHTHGHSHEHDHGHHQHPHRNLDDVRKIIESSDLPQPVKQKAVAVFVRLANAEAKVHGTTVDKIHFHEVGALDAIADIVGTVAGLHELGIERLYASGMPLGHGWTDSQHGKIPLPAPATLQLLSAANAPSRPNPGPGELVTPTGAALVCELAKFEQPMMRLQKIAIGAGKRETAWPNAARLWLGTELSLTSDSSQKSIVQIETNIDDMNPQFYGPLSERLFAAGALDVWLVPMQMKKNRPGVLLGVLAPASTQRTVADIILRETTTLGVRVHPVERFEAEREIRSITTPYGAVQVKLKTWGGQIVGAMPEYEDCRRLAETKNLPVKLVYESAFAAAQELLMQK